MPIPFFFFALLACFSFLFLSLALVGADLAVVGLGYSLINKLYICYFLLWAGVFQNNPNV